MVAFFFISVFIACRQSKMNVSKYLFLLSIRNETEWKSFIFSPFSSFTCFLIVNDEIKSEKPTVNQWKRKEKRKKARSVNKSVIGREAQKNVNEWCEEKWRGSRKEKLKAKITTKIGRDEVDNDVRMPRLEMSSGHFIIDGNRHFIHYRILLVRSPSLTAFAHLAYAPAILLSSSSIFVIVIDFVLILFSIFFILSPKWEAKR